MLYTVRYGDTIASIAAAHHIYPASLYTANQMDPHIKSIPGQSIIIPDESSPIRSLIIHGCAMPNVGDTALSYAAPYLSFISICSCRIQTDGSIIPPNDHSLTSRAHSLGISPLLHITNQRQGGEFSDSLLHAFIHNNEATASFAEMLLQYLFHRNYMGVNIEFDCIYPEDNQACSDFLHRIGSILRNHQLKLFISTSDISGLLPSIYDCADRIIILPKLRYHASQPPAPICPIEEMRKSIQQALHICKAEKLMLALPYYGCNWTLPYHGGIARTVYLSEIPSLAYNHYADIRYDDTVQAPHFSYYDSAGTEHIVWFHDPRSISARVKLAEEYHLGGISLGNIAPPYRPGWIPVADMYSPRKEL